LCFGVLVWSLMFSLLILYFFFILILIPLFVEVKKLRNKKTFEDSLIKQTVIINKNLPYNFKFKKFLV
jgi:hypothetical protein